MGGKIVTFYSYKGGTGRTMALANVAWILSGSGYRVLAIDWDFEAPGLHRYFLPFLSDPELTETRGLIDLLWEFTDLSLTPKDAWPPGLKDTLELADAQRYAVPLEFPFEESKGSLHFLCAGKQEIAYGDRLRDFDWRSFYERLGGNEFLDTLASRARSQYDFTLIDSRTGVADTSGICTVHMPDEIVLCFTYNRQGVNGIAAVSESIIRQRTPCPTLWPIAMRVEKGVDGLEEARRFARGTLSFTIRVRMNEEQELQYWDNCEIAHYPDYCFGEVVSVFRDPPRQRQNTLLSDMLRLTRLLAHDQERIVLPELDQQYRRIFLRRYDFLDRRKAEVAELSEQESMKAYTRCMELLGDARTDRNTPIDVGTALLEGAVKVANRLNEVGKLEQASRLLGAARQLAEMQESEKAAELLLDILTSISGIARKRGMFAEAFKAAKEAEVACDRLSKPDQRVRAGIKGHIADLFEAVGQFDEALRIRREEEFPVYKQVNELEAAAATAGKIADLLEAKGDLAEALRIRREEELCIVNKIGDIRAAGMTTGKIADLLMAKGDLEGALRMRREEELIYERLGDVAARAVALGKIADLLESLGRIDDAIKLKRHADVLMAESRDLGLMEAPIRLFYSYSHKDEGLRKLLELHLAVLRRSGMISEWHDREIMYGEDWKSMIERQLSSADLILPLVSADYLASDYIWGLEMSLVIERHERGEARVLPVILRPCSWHMTPLGKLQVVPKGGRPVTSWDNPDEALVSVVEGITTCVEEIRAKRARPSTPSEPPISMT